MLARLLDAVEGHASVSEYVVAERRRHVTALELGRTSRARIVEATASVYRDEARGRGSASVSFPLAHADELRAIVARTVARAARVAGPSWQLPPPAAPARVRVLDRALADDAEAALHELEQRVARAIADGGEAATAAGEPLRAAALRAVVDHHGTALHTSAGFRGRYESTRIALQLTLVAGEARGRPTRAVSISLTRRRVEDLGLETELRAAAGRLRDLARAEPLAPGRYELALTGPALIEPPGARFGWFAAIAAQADGAAARRGLARYLPGQSIFRGAAPTGDPLTIHSNGALDYGTDSEPFGELGEPVRRFALVTEGVAAGLALDVREAGLLGVLPNGGVRNLEVAPGSLAAGAELAPSADGATPLRVEAMSTLSLDPRTGDFVGAIDLGYLGDQPVRDGIVRGDLYALLAGARLSSELLQAGWYHGPRSIRLPAVDVV